MVGNRRGISAVSSIRGYRLCSSGVERNRASRLGVPNRSACMAPHNAWNARGADGQLAARSGPIRKPTVRSKKQALTQPQRHLSPNTAGLPAPNQLIDSAGWSSVSYQIPRRGLFRTESWSPWDMPRSCVRDAASNAHINRDGISTAVVHARSSPSHHDISKKNLWAKSPICNAPQNTCRKFDRALTELQRSLFAQEQLHSTFKREMEICSRPYSTHATFFEQDIVRALTQNRTPRKRWHRDS